jgi:hypothetical protein
MNPMPYYRQSQGRSGTMETLDGANQERSMGGAAGGAPLLMSYRDEQGPPMNALAGGGDDAFAMPPTGPSADDRMQDMVGAMMRSRSPEQAQQVSTDHLVKMLTHKIMTQAETQADAERMLQEYVTSTGSGGAVAGNPQALDAMRRTAAEVARQLRLAPPVDDGGNQRSAPRPGSMITPDYTNENALATKVSDRHTPGQASQDGLELNRLGGMTPPFVQRNWTLPHASPNDLPDRVYGKKDLDTPFGEDRTLPGDSQEIDIGDIRQAHQGMLTPRNLRSGYRYLEDAARKRGVEFGEEFADKGGIETYLMDAWQRDQSPEARKALGDVARSMGVKPPWMRVPRSWRGM